MGRVQPSRGLCRAWEGVCRRRWERCELRRIGRRRCWASTQSGRRPMRWRWLHRQRRWHRGQCVGQPRHQGAGGDCTRQGKREDAAAAMGRRRRHSGKKRKGRCGSNAGQGRGRSTMGARLQGPQDAVDGLRGARRVLGVGHRVGGGSGSGGHGRTGLCAVVEVEGDGPTLAWSGQGGGDQAWARPLQRRRLLSKGEGPAA